MSIEKKRKWLHAVLAKKKLWDCFCCANSTSGLKSIIVNKRKLNNKHTQRTQEFTWFGKLPTSTATTEKFHYKNREIQ